MVLDLAMYLVLGAALGTVGGLFGIGGGLIAIPVLGVLFGLWGIALALPLMAVIKVVLEQVYIEDTLDEEADV